MLNWDDPAARFKSSAAPALAAVQLPIEEALPRPAPIQPPASERLSVEALVRGFTIDAAYQLHMEDEIGSIEVGKKADLAVLDQDIFSIDPYAIHRTKVVLTMLDGAIVYEAPE